MPAWMIAEEILSKAERILMESALELLRSQIKSGTIKVDGTFVPSSEASGEAERDLFLMEKLIADEENLYHRYQNLVSSVESGKEQDMHIVERMEEIKKFLLSVSQISLTAKNAKVFREWFSDAGSKMSIKDPAEILDSTAMLRQERASALEFFVGNKKFINSEILMPEEIEILKKAYSLLGKENFNKVQKL